ncbi:MAG: hypothetical protein KA419_10805 [Acidobacteria bacterium]|nr:hypothetical protein [Acidobacteriota bacterium]
MNRTRPRSLLVAAVIALTSGVVLSSANFKLVQVLQVCYLMYTDGVTHPCVYVTGPDLPSPADVYLIGSTTAEEEQMLRMAVTALEKGFYGVIDLQGTSPCYSSFFAVQNVPVAGARPGTAAALPAPPAPPPVTAGIGGAVVGPPGQGAAVRPAPAADWRAVTVLQVQTLHYIDGVHRPCLSVTEDGSSYYNIYILGESATLDDWGFRLGLTALRCGRRAVVNRQLSGTPDVYFTPTVALQDIPVP